LFYLIDNGGVTKGGGREAQLPPDAVDEGAQKGLTENILTTTEVSLMKFAGRANSSPSQQTITILLPTC